MAPRKRTPTEMPEDAPVKEAKPKATKTAVKKPAKAAPKVAAPKAEPAKRKAKAAPKAAPMPEVVPAPKAAPRKRAAKPVTAAKPMAEAEPLAMAKPAPSEVKPTAAFTPHAQKVMEAIAAGRAIELIFTDADAYPPRTFEARQLLFDVFTGSWFVWGWDRRYNAERHHRLDLLAEINPVEGPGRSAQGPFPEGTPFNQIGGWRGGEPIPVKAVLQKQWIFAVKQAPAPFPDFRIEDLEDGKAQISFTGTDLRAIARWCMQFGDGLQVQEPQRLVDRIRQVGVSWAGKAAAVPPPAPRAQSRPEPRPEARPEARPESRPEPRPEHRPRKEFRESREPREARESRETRESEAPKGKPARLEVRVERL